MIDLSVKSESVDQDCIFGIVPDGREKRGKVVRVRVDRGFGFISIAGEENAEAFFHHNALQDGISLSKLRPGDEVSFLSVPSQTKKGGIDAKKVNLISRTKHFLLSFY